MTVKRRSDANVLQKHTGGAAKVQNGQFALMPEKTSQAFQGLKQALDDARSAKEHRQMGALLATGSTEKGISMQMSLLLTESSSIFEMPLPLMFCFEIRILQIMVMNHGVGVFKLHQKYALGQRHEQSASGEMKVVPRLKICSTVVSLPANLNLDGMVCLSTFAPACREELQLRGFVQVHFAQPSCGFPSPSPLS